MPTEQEIQQWTEKIAALLPQAKVLGVIQEGEGLLLGINQKGITAEDMQHFEAQLIKAGAHAWSWSAGPTGARLRVHMSNKRINFLWIAAVAVVAYVAYYDIHLAEIAGHWAGAWK